MARNDWIRASERNPCPICKDLHRTQGWCLIHVDGAAVICPRVMEGSTRDLGESGYLHRLDDGNDRDPRPRRVRAVAHARTVTLPTIDAEEYANRCVSDLDSEKFEFLVRHLDIMPAALLLLDVGWCERLRVYTFPMRDGRGKAIGIRTRSITGDKKAVVGSRSGLFVPNTLRTKPTLYVCEGPTDAAAMLALGLMAIGRASCRGGKEHILEFVRRHKYNDIVVMADNDPPDQNGRRPGLDGSRKLAEELYGHLRHRGGYMVRVGYIPIRYKDVREHVTTAIREHGKN